MAPTPVSLPAGAAAYPPRAQPKAEGQPKAKAQPEAGRRRTAKQKAKAKAHVQPTPAKKRKEFVPSPDDELIYVRVPFDIQSLPRDMYPRQIEFCQDVDVRLMFRKGNCYKGQVDGRITVKGRHAKWCWQNVLKEYLEHFEASGKTDLLDLMKKQPVHYRRGMLEDDYEEADEEQQEEEKRRDRQNWPKHKKKESQERTEAEGGHDDVDFGGDTEQEDEDDSDQDLPAGKELKTKEEATIFEREDDKEEENLNKEPQEPPPEMTFPVPVTVKEEGRNLSLAASPASSVAGTPRSAGDGRNLPESSAAGDGRNLPAASSTEEAAPRRSTVKDTAAMWDRRGKQKSAAASSSSTARPSMPQRPAPIPRNRFRATQLPAVKLTVDDSGLKFLRFVFIIFFFEGGYVLVAVVVSASFVLFFFIKICNVFFGGCL